MFWGQKSDRVFCTESHFINLIMLYGATGPLYLLSIYIVSSVYCLSLKFIMMIVFKSCYEKDEHQHVEQSR